MKNSIFGNGHKYQASYEYKSYVIYCADKIIIIFYETNYLVFDKDEKYASKK